MTTTPPSPYLIFDAGGTLVFPSRSFYRAEALAAGVQVSPQDVFSAYAHVIYDLDLSARQQGALPEVWPHSFAWEMFSRLGLAEPELSEADQAAEERNRRQNLWNDTFPWVQQALSTLAESGYRMSVISNADGRVAQLLESLDLARYFERIYDSEIVGIEKPAPGIFHLALNDLNLDPQEAIYIGDVYYIDVAGANAAGMGAVHLDPLGLYDGWPGVHLPDIHSLPAWLERWQESPERFNLYPLDDHPR